MRVVSGDSVFVQPSWVVVRPQKGQYLFYNSRTDELHLIPSTGHVVYTLCDGLRTVDDIAAELSSAVDAEPAALQAELGRFIAELQLRGLVELAHA